MEFLEFFAGRANTTKFMRVSHYRAAKFDLLYGPDSGKKAKKKEIKLHGHAFGCWICVPSLKCKIKLYYSRAACFSPSFLSSYHWPPTDLHHFSGWRWSSSWKDALLTRDSWWFWRWNAHRGSMSIRGQVDVVLVAHLASPIFHPF